MSLFAHMIKDGKFENHFLDLLLLNRTDAKAIFETVAERLGKSKLDIKHTRFAGMKGCSTMAGEYTGVKAATYHFVYIHRQNH